MNPKYFVNKIKSILISAGFQSSQIPDLVMPIIGKKLGQHFGCKDLDNKLSLLEYPQSQKRLKAKGVYDELTNHVDSLPLGDINTAEIMTIEEELKTLFRSMAGEANGQHYTPDDIHQLIMGILATNEEKDSGYDPTCGGGNLIGDMGKTFGLKRVCGQEYNEQTATFANIMFSAIEGYQIEQGNTLTDDKFKGETFSLISSNPPYGTSWASFANDVDFEYLPKKADAQMLFVQHVVSKMSDCGMAVIVMNGSPMFSGDVNSGESQCRKWLLDNNLVKAWVQLPNDEFYNTGITTYLWILKKGRESEDIVLINAKDWSEKLKKPQGKKTNKLTEEAIEKIPLLITSPIESDDVKVMSKYDFYYNKQKLDLKKHDDVYQEELHLYAKAIESNEKARKPKQYDKDYEIIPYSPCKQKNEQNIQQFLDKWVRKQYVLGTNDVGVEVNFNKVFYKPVVLRSTAEIAADIHAVDGELDTLEKELWG